MTAAECQAQSCGLVVASCSAVYVAAASMHSTGAYVTLQRATAAAAAHLLEAVAVSTLAAQVLGTVLCMHCAAMVLLSRVLLLRAASY
jgi:hypothetical protein